MTIEIGMPVYRPSGRLEAVLTALALQTYKDFFITIYNDTPPHETEEIRKDEEIVSRMREEYGLEIKLVQNERNLGYMANMHQIFNKASGDILFLLADDDIVSTDCMELLAEAFKDSRVGCVSRPYYWFIDDFRKAVRFEGRIGKKIKKVHLLRSPLKDALKCMTGTGQLSGLGFRMSLFKKLKRIPFTEDMFTAHVYPFLYAFKHSLCAYMPEPTIAVSISTSQCQNDIYDPSPVEQWIRLYRSILKGPKYAGRRDELIEAQVTTDFMGFAQIKNYGTMGELWREIGNFVKYRKKNLLDPKFYVFAVGSLVIPRSILKKMVDWYKDRFNSKKLEALNIDYDRFPFAQIEDMWSFSDINERAH